MFQLALAGSVAEQASTTGRLAEVAPGFAEVAQVRSNADSVRLVAVSSAHVLRSPPPAGACCFPELPPGSADHQPSLLPVTVNWQLGMQHVTKFVMGGTPSTAMGARKPVLVA